MLKYKNVENKTMKIYNIFHFAVGLVFVIVVSVFVIEVVVVVLVVVDDGGVLNEVVVVPDEATPPAPPAPGIPARTEPPPVNADSEK
jgi:hypothetical protein